MTTRKKKNKIRDNTLTSLEKFNTTRKRDIMKGGTLSNNELAMNMSGGKLSSYAQAKDELITFINTKNLEIKLAQINTAKDLSATIDSDGTISNLGNGGSLYDAGLRQGDIILSYETKDTSNNIQKYAFIGDEKFLDTFKRTKISKISYITKDSIEKNSARANTILAELMEKIKQRIDAANESKIYIQYEHFTSTSQSITTPAQPANIATTATATGAATAPPIQPIATLPIITTQQVQALEEEKKRLTEAYTISDGSLNKYLTENNLDIKEVTIDNTTKYLGFGVYANGIITGVQDKGEISNAGLTSGDLILSYTIKQPGGQQLEDSSYIFIDQITFIKNSTSKSITINYIKTPKVTQELNKLILSRIEARNDLDKLVTIDADYKKAEDDLNNFIGQSLTTKVFNATIESATFGFATYANGTIASDPDPAGSIAKAGLKINDIILTYNNKDDANTNIYIGIDDFVAKATKQPITIEYIKRTDLGTNKDKLIAHIDARRKAKLTFDKYVDSLVKTSGNLAGNSAGNPKEEIIATEAAIADKEKAIKYIEQTIESKKAQNEDPKVEEFELYALVAEKKALIANKDLLSETINGNDTAKINDLKKKYADAQQIVNKERIAAAGAAIADKEKAIKDIRQKIEFKKSKRNSEDTTVEDHELYALEAEKNALIANKDLWSETKNGNNSKKIKELKEKYNDAHLTANNARISVDLVEKAQLKKAATATAAVNKTPTDATAADATAAEAKELPTEAAKAAVPGQPISRDQEIKNTIGAIILALALTISESMPKTKIGNSSGKKYSKEEIEKMQEQYAKLTTEIKSTITTKRTSYEARFNEIKTKSGNKKSKKMELIAVLNNLLTNKRTIEEFEEPDLDKSDEKNMAGGGGCSIYDTDPECTLGSNFYNAKTKEIENHRRTINEIMSYLLEEKINMKYEWVAIKGIGGKDKDLYKGKVGIISKLNNNNTEDVDIKGKWAFEVWIPDKGGLTTLVRPDDNGLKKKLKVKNSKQEIIDKFLTKNISIYEVQFLDKQYDHTNDINFQPVIDGENLEPISSLKKNFLAKNYNTITNAINPTDFAQGTYTTAEGLTTALTTRGLREDLKDLIKNVIETKFTEKKAVSLLTRKINFYNKKKSIKDILISKISYIFASGETRLNLFNRSNVKKNFKEDEEAQNDGEEAQNDGEEAQQGGEETQKGGEEGDYIKEGGGGYGTRNFDKDDAKNFIKFILESLTALHYENIPKTTKNLLFSNYLKALLKITPSELNKLLLDIENISELSNNVIEHYINRLTNNQKSVSDQSTTPAAKISKLNFALKSNVQAFTRSIVDITLHSEQMVGSEEKVEEYLDNEYNKAMKLPTGEDQGRISNFELKSALNSILGPNINTIKGYKEKIQKIDSHIDSINAKNITTKLRDFNTVFSLGKLENGTIIYNLPDKISGNLKAQETEKTKEATLEASSKEKLNQAVELLKEMLASSKDTDTTTQKQKLQQFLTSLNPKDEE